MEKRTNALCCSIVVTLLICFVGIVAGAGGSIKAGNVAGSVGESQQKSTSALIDLYEENWQSMLKGEWMVEL